MQELNPAVKEGFDAEIITFVDPTQAGCLKSGAVK